MRASKTRQLAIYARRFTVLAHPSSLFLRARTLERARARAREHRERDEFSSSSTARARRESHLARASTAPMRRRRSAKTTARAMPRAASLDAARASRRRAARRRRSEKTDGSIRADRPARASGARRGVTAAGRRAEKRAIVKKVDTWRESA
jgi:hypothetical protein